MTYAYNSLGRLVGESAPVDVNGTVSEVAVAEYAYDPNGNLLAVTDGNNNTTTYSYNCLNERT